MNRNKINNYIYLLGLIFIICLFSFITYVTPLAGDDWCYAVNGLEGNVFVTAINFYKTWSGRFFSELWGFVVTNNKWVWNVINPILFTTIYFCIYKLSGCSKNNFFIVLLIIAFMLSVKDNVRMETYTWIMGTTYIIPLCFSLIYFFVFDYVFQNKLSQKYLYLCNVIIFIGGMMMENISAATIVGIVLLIIYCSQKNKGLLKPLIINLVFAVISFLLMRSSPGAATRLARDFPAWSELSLFGKITHDYPMFIKMTFIENNYMIMLFSITLVYLVISSKEKIRLLYRIPLLINDVIAAVIVFMFIFVGEDNILINGGSIFSSIYWPLYVILAFTQIILFLPKGYKKDKVIFFLVVGGSAALAMIMSPIYGSRSAIYTIYYIIVVSSIILSEIDINKVLKISLIAMLLVIIVDRTNEYIYKYNLVRETNKLRISQTNYYVSHPEEEFAGFERFPIYTIHGIDIEWDDMYHMQAFKQLYKIPQDLDKIYFYAGEGQQ